jgi:hypothetical protein
MKIMHCWACGELLHVAKDRAARRSSKAGENTIDPNIRVCKTCWAAIKRVQASAAGDSLSQHGAALR